MKIETRSKFNIGQTVLVQLRTGLGDRDFKTRIEAIFIKIDRERMHFFYDVKNGPEMCRVREEIIRSLNEG